MHVKDASQQVMIIYIMEMYITIHTLLRRQLQEEKYAIDTSSCTTL